MRTRGQLSLSSLISHIFVTFVLVCVFWYKDQSHITQYTLHQKTTIKPKHKKKTKSMNLGNTLNRAQDAQMSKARQFKAQAEAKMASRTWFSASTEQKYDDGADLYLQAANAFKVGGFYGDSASMYTEAAHIYADKLKQSNDAAKAWSEAAAMHRKNVDVKHASEAYQYAIQMLCDSARLAQAARLLSRDVGEMLVEEGEYVQAMECYEQARDLYGMDSGNNRSHASNCAMKVAELCSSKIDPPDYAKAAKLYADMGKDCLDNNLLKYSAKGYFLQSVLCQMANGGDCVGASQSLERFMSLDVSFRESREGKFCTGLIECLESFDPDGFATVCFEYDRISRLDEWKTDILFKIKSTISPPDADDSNDNDVVNDSSPVLSSGFGEDADEGDVDLT